MYFINGLFCFFQNLKLKASTTPNIYICIYIILLGSIAVVYFIGAIILAHTHIATCIYMFGKNKWSHA